MVFKNRVKNIQAMAYNGVHIVAKYCCPWGFVQTSKNHEKSDFLSSFLVP